MADGTAMTTLQRFCRDEDGATAIEYGLLAAIMAVGLITALTSVRNNISDMFNTVGTAAKNAN